jgi:hypothetical protein
MRVSDHFRDDVIGPERHPSREGITYERCVRIVSERRYTEASGDELIVWGYAPELPGHTKWLKVVTDAEASVLITAHKDRRFARRMGTAGEQGS